MIYATCATRSRLLPTSARCSGYSMPHVLFELMQSDLANGRTRTVMRYVLAAFFMTGGVAHLSKGDSDQTGK
jgi:hypothetical protein